MRPHRRTGYEISDQQWLKIAQFLAGKVGDVGRSATDNRLVINAVLWIARSRAIYPNALARLDTYKGLERRWSYQLEKPTLAALNQ